MQLNRSFASVQEELIFNFSTRILGPHALFQPEKTSASEEPADLVWYADRCVILMYMRRSVQGYEKKVSHNLRQLRRWLGKWSAGRELVGSSHGESGQSHFQIAFSDVDHIVGLSVIGGGETWCEFHSDEVQRNSQRKLAACATVTERALLELARSGGGPREIVYWLSHLHQFKGRMSDGRLVGAMHLQQSQEMALVRFALSNVDPLMQLPSRVSEHDVIPFLKSMETYVQASFSAIRGHDVDREEVGRISVDLTFADLYWFGLVSQVLASKVPPPGEYGPLVLASMRKSGMYQLRYAVAANSKVLAQRMEEMTKVFGNSPGLSLIHSLDVGRSSPWGMMLLHPRVGTSHLRAEILDLARTVIAAKT